LDRITARDILDIAAYERVRPARREAIIRLKAERRVTLGPSLSVVFENRDTVLFQIQEMMRTERIVDEARIQAEIDVYNGQIPEPGELSATLFIEIPGVGAMSREEAVKAVNEFQGLDAGGVVLHAGATDVAAAFESGYTKEEKMAAVQFLRFRPDAAARRALADRTAGAALSARNARYQARTELSPVTRAHLIADLE
jgi:hypothetical protein